jgi:hypothetical protein
MKKIAIALILGLVLVSVPSAMAAEYVGVGIQCATYGETIAKVKDITVGDVFNELVNSNAEIEGDIKCITYRVYNPFDVKLQSSLEFRGEVEDLLISLEPESVTVDPEFHELPEDGIPVRACFKIKTKYPYTPKRYTGSTMAVWSMSKDIEGGGAGSATGGSVECPLYLQVNTQAGQEVMLDQRGQAMFKIQVLIVVIIAVIVLLIVLGIYKRKKRKEWETKVRNVCVKCKKQYPLNLDHCPKCGSKLRKYKAGQEV